MNSFTCTVRILEIPCIVFYQNTIPFTKFKIEIAQARNFKTSTIVEAQIWGKLAYDLKKYYHLNDYLIMEGSFSINHLLNNTKPKETILKFNISRFYPFFVKNALN